MYLIKAYFLNLEPSLIKITFQKYLRNEGINIDNEWYINCFSPIYLLKIDLVIKNVHYRTCYFANEKSDVSGPHKIWYIN